MIHAVFTDAYFIQTNSYTAYMKTGVQSAYLQTQIDIVIHDAFMYAERDREEERDLEYVGIVITCPVCNILVNCLQLHVYHISFMVLSLVLMLHMCM